MQWEDFIDQQGPLVYRTALRIVGQAADAEDVVQDVFLEVHRLWRHRSVDRWPGLLRTVRGTAFQYFEASSLTVLNLDGALITDQTLIHISHMESLTEVHVRRTAVTAGGVRRLGELAPHIHVFK